MRTVIRLVLAFVCVQVGYTQPAPEAFDAMKSLVGEWEASLEGYGTLTNSIRLVSNGTAIEETIGTSADNETSIYTRDGARVLLTHFCALTAGGHQVRLETPKLGGVRRADLEFAFVGATNLPHLASPHMRHVQISMVDRDHFLERWTKTEDGKDVIFSLHFVRTKQSPPAR